MSLPSVTTISITTTDIRLSNAVGISQSFIPLASPTHRPSKQTLSLTMAPVTRSATSDKPRRRYTNTLPKDKAQPKPLEKFHYFPKLPPELRITIWEMAIRPRDIRGVHYFSLFKSTGDRESPLLDLAVANRQLSEYEKKYETFLLNIEHRAAAPRVAAYRNHAYPPEYSWFKDNRSLYAWDAGLFNACWESSWIISKSIKPGLVFHEWVIKVRHNRETVYLRDHRQDLFCFEFEREDVEASMSIRWGVLLPQLSFGRFALSPSNIAFEFHPNWVTSLPEKGEPFDLHREPSPRGLVARVFDAFCRREIPSHISVWLIDRSIRVSNKTSPWVVKVSPWVFSDLQHTYVGIESRDVFYGPGKKKRERNTAFYLCKRLNSRKRSIRGAPRRSCLGVLALRVTDSTARTT